jgi:photosystem II stability/assembly factor-like uncharacterized protein
MRTLFRFTLVIVAFTATFLQAADTLAANQLSGLEWRSIGPFRGGRVTAVAGVAGDPNTYYFGTPGGGVWKSTDAGQVWKPIFDSARVASIGSLAVAASDPNIIYVGTGEQTRGNGIYRSSDAGATWKNVGLPDVLFIQEIVVDPRNPDIVIVAGNSVGIGVLWRPLPRWANTANRGIFKTTDGGKSWKKVFNDDSSLGIMDMCADPTDPQSMFAVVYRPASESPKVEADSYIVKSTDQGSTWKQLATSGLPDKARKRMGVVVAGGTGGHRLYAILDQGFFRSDDGGSTWTQSTKDPRVKGSPYFSRVFADPNHPDVVYVAQTSMYRSTDGGKTFEAFAGAPSGDDFHVMWIDPRDSSRIFFGVDQGAIVSSNGGKTWSSWYNQPTGQFYHVSTDNSFPYRVYGAQQDSGTASVLSRSDYGQILLQDWNSVGGFEYAFIAPDPAHPNFVYSGGWYGSVVRYDRQTGQIATVFEHGRKYRVGQMPPLVFSPQDPKTLYLGTQFVMKTSDGAATWQEISPDLTGYVAGHDEEGGRIRPPAITALAPSTIQAGQIWAGTSNRLVYLTRDAGANWQNVSPPELADPLQVLYVEASHHDPATAYLTVGATRESTPAYIARTHDYGKTWQKIVNGIPENEMVRVLREDPKRKGLLYAGTDTSVYVSWDDGDNWQSLSLNLPATPITDLQVHDNDVVVSTFGRSFWILDNVSPLRNLRPASDSANAYLFPPAPAMRVRWENYQDTPWPAETPAGRNPSDGITIDYFLKEPVTGELALNILDEKGQQVASFSSEPKPDHHLPPNVPEYWFSSPPLLTKSPGINRFVWNLRYPAPASLPYSYGGELLEYAEYTLADHAVPGLTPRQQPQGPLVAPGKYTLELRYGGQTSRQELSVGLDPRVHTTAADLIAQRDQALMIDRGMKASYDAFMQITALQQALAASESTLSADAKAAADQLNSKLDPIQKGKNSTPGFGLVNRDLGRLIFSVENADMRPVQAVIEAVQQTCEALDKDLAAWNQLNQQDIKSLNDALAHNGRPALPVVTAPEKGCGP